MPILTDRDPLFSVVITCYNYERYVDISISSALNQDYKNLEVIVIDDGSTDSSWDIISKYDGRIKAISTENRGFIAACAKGLSLSSGAYIIFLDADDELMPTAISKIVQTFRDPDVTKVQFLMQPIDQSGARFGSPFPNLAFSECSRSFIEDIKTSGCYATPPTSGNAYRSDIYRSLGDLSYDYGIDGVAYLLAPFKGKVFHLSEVLANYRIHDKNMSTSSLSEGKFLRNESVFMKRLRHLDRLLREQNIPTHGFAVREEYAYTIECKLYAAIVAGDQSRFALLWKYARFLRPYRGKRDLFLIAFLTVAAVLPRGVALRLLTLRLNQNRASKFRSIVKKVVAPY